jgi:hypothetical protein
MFYAKLLQRFAISFVVFFGLTLAAGFLSAEAQPIVLTITAFALAMYWGALALQLTLRLLNKEVVVQNR